MGFELPTKEDLEFYNFTVIGLIGSAGSGKSTVARYIKRKYKAKWLDFATPIRDMLVAFDLSRNRPNSSKLLEINSKNLTAQDAKHNQLELAGVNSGITTRTLLQKLGTEFGRNIIDENLWVMKLYDTIYRDVNPDNTELIIIDGIRFNNEVEFINRFPRHAFLSVGRDSNEATLTETELKHLSESGVDWGLIATKDIYPIDNSGALADTYMDVDAIMYDLGIKKGGK